MILIHGGPGFTHHYLEPLYRLANERPVVFYDQLGCGKSDRPHDLSYCNINYFVSELDNLIQHLGYNKLSLLGHSWGSAIAAEYAIVNHNVTNLIFASPFLSAPLWNEDIKLYKKALPRDLSNAIETTDYNSEKFLAAHEEYYKWHVYGTAQSDRSIILSTEESSRDVYYKMWGPDEFTINGELKDYDCTGNINQVSARVLFTCGEFDTGSPRACKLIAKKIKGSSISIFPGCAHFPHLEKKEDYIRCIRSFLKDEKVKPSGSLAAKLLRYMERKTSSAN